MKLIYILYGFGILFSVSGIGYLAMQYIRYLSEPARLAVLVLMVGFFAFLGKYFESIGW